MDLKDEFNSVCPNYPQNRLRTFVIRLSGGTLGSVCFSYIKAGDGTSSNIRFLATSRKASRYFILSEKCELSPIGVPKS
jgi:hypothetical protein